MLSMIAGAMALLDVQSAADPKAVPPSAEEVAAARTHAEEIIRQADAADVFDNITTADGVPLVKHRASGMTCSFSGDDGDYVRVFPAGGGVPRGDDVACGAQIMGAEHTTYATRYPDRHSAAVDLQAAVQAIVQRLPDARVHQGEFPVVNREGGPEVLAAAYDITIDGKPRLTMVLVSKVGEWNLKHRATGERGAEGAQGDTMLPLVAGMSFLLSLPGERDRNAGSGKAADDL